MKQVALHPTDGNVVVIFTKKEEGISAFLGFTDQFGRKCQRVIPADKSEVVFKLVELIYAGAVVGQEPEAPVENVYEEEKK